MLSALSFHPFGIDGKSPALSAGNCDGRARERPSARGRGSGHFSVEDVALTTKGPMANLAPVNVTKLVFRCRHCGTMNRVPQARLTENPVCGRCKNSLDVTNGPQDVEPAALER